MATLPGVSGSLDFMSAAVDEITEAALTLPELQRAALANTLLASLDEHTDGPAEVKAAWTGEIRSRVDDLISGRVKGVPLDEVKALLAADRAARRR